MSSTLTEIRELFSGSRHFAILSHVRPDGDAYGTSLALAWLLKERGHEVQVFNQDGLIPSFRYLPGADWIQPTPAEGIPAEWHLLAVDTSTYERLGPHLTQTGRKPELNLDHHASNTAYGQLNWVFGDSPASAQVLFELIEQLQYPLNAAIATNLYVGLMTDTGSFRYRGTSARTLAVASQLISAGADPAYLADQSYRRNSLGRFLLMREVLNRVQFHAGQRVATYRMTPDLWKSTGAGPDEVENYLDLLQTIDTVEVAFMLQELEDGTVRVSLRSREKVNVSQIAALFGGGGHRLAAGIKSTLASDVLESSLLREIEAALPTSSF